MLGNLEATITSSRCLLGLRARREFLLLRRPILTSWLDQWYPLMSCAFRYAPLMSGSLRLCSGDGSQVPPE